jgi:GNAT superfamily N-acetyltransferase
VKIGIRAATLGDIEELARLRWQLYTEYEPDIAETLDRYRERFIAFARDALGRDDWRAWVAEEAGRLVAAMWLHTVPRVPAPGRADPSPIGYLTNVYVESTHRGHGLGSEMLRGVLEHCASAGFELVVTWPADPSYAFYERAGFTRLPDPVVHGLWR